jgi:type VI secretion system protein ImpM
MIFVVRLCNDILAFAVIGFFGKVPAKGDFVQAGLPRSFVDAWDRWLQDRLAASRCLLGEAWTELWMEAPIWRFRLARALCGPDPVAGLWMPSVDRVGREFPMTFAGIGVGTSWLDGAEAIGLAALEEDLTPDAISSRLQELPVGLDEGETSFGTIWWTQGAPAVAASNRRYDAMPSREAFAAMLTDAAPPITLAEPGT